jgi:flagellar biosynthetic protein FlhB
MADEDDASKTEDPTDKKLADAHKKGQIASSQEVKNFGILIAATIALMSIAPSMLNNLRVTLFPFVEKPDAFSLDFETVRSVFLELILDLAWIMAPIFGLLIIAALFSNIIQSGMVWATEKIKPDLSKISFKKGVKRMFSINSFMEFTKGILKLLVVGLVAFGMVMPMLDDIRLMPQVDFLFSLERIHEIAIVLASGTIAVMAVIAGIDFTYQKYKFSKDQRMTKQEVKDEQKQSEGDPLVKGRIRQIRMERAKQRMMDAVPDADVIVTNPTHYSVALKYDMEEMAAPKLVAKGVDHLAFRIREVAKENDVPLVENPPLARALYAAVEIDEEIPGEHFQAVAEVIGYVMRLRGQLPN